MLGLTWCLLLYFHASNQWVGIAFPMVMVFTYPAVFVYLWGRLCRLYRFYRWQTSPPRVVLLPMTEQTSSTSGASGSGGGADASQKGELMRFVTFCHIRPCPAIP